MYCTKCGNKLKNEDKFCTKCGNPAKGTSVFEKNGIKITTYVKSSQTEYDANEDEREVADVIIEDLEIDKTLFDYKKTSEDYSTITYKNIDLFRLKYTERTRWIKIIIFNSYKKEYIDSLLFETQKNKRQIYWKSQIHNIFDYKEILLKAIKEIDNDSLLIKT